METVRFIEPFPGKIDAELIDASLTDIDLLGTDIDEELVRKIEASHNWSLVFGDSLWNRLADGACQDKAEVAKQLTEYNKWVSENAHTLSSELLELCESLPAHSKDRSTIGKELNHSFFHRQNVLFLPMWNELLTQNGPVSDTSIYRQVQKNVAMQGVQDARLRDKMIEQDTASYYSNAPESRRAFMEGLLSEQDSGVVLLQAAKAKNTGWIVLPAPAAFEYLSLGANSDYIVIDPSNNQAVGVQVKNMIRNHNEISRYDKDRVVFIDTATDFDNQKYIEYMDGQRNIRRVVNFNGLMSFERLKSMKLTKDEQIETAGLANYAQAKSRGFNERLISSSEIIKSRIIEKIRAD